MEDYLRAVTLGIVQAVTEFLPVSSSGHLLLARELIGEDVDTLTFDVGLHLGTTVAVIAYFWRDWARIISAGVADISAHGPRIGRWGQHSRLGLWIALGTLPAVVVGLLLGATIEQHLREPLLVGVMLVLVGVLIGVVDAWGATALRLLDVTAGRSLVVGIAQAAALVPGVSRSGITIVAGRALGFDRASAACFSFLLSAPVVVGAVTLKFSEALAADEAVQWGPMAAGAFVAAVVGMAVIRALLGFLRSGTLRPFVWYRIALGLAVIAASLGGAI